ncbi:hypothetical protein EDD34_2388 [Myceligenerans xiligouense]|uniref:Uncharacterized protein n=2 Tax=Myceligenerans xiligouense TaxID=253184 RepID=A0A3N4YM64_9MICO|nr:hypothetical protein EDD34_2388 [Myceligenerans xiligouense]
MGAMAATYVEKFQVIVDMFEFGVQAYRQRMRREHPAASDEEIEGRVQTWLLQPSDRLGNQIHLPARG